jgi:predicted Rdx family selenoprotein
VEVWAIGLALGLAVGAGLIAKGIFNKAISRREFANDPVQARLAAHIEAYLYSVQDDDAYRALSEGVRGEFEVLGVASRERVWLRLMHAAGLNHEQVKRGLRDKLMPKQTLGAAKALNQLSEDL